MPSVPYSGAPSVAPGGDPTPRYVADVSPNTFGANVGAALQGLGKTAEGAGNEIFARGLAMQDLYNHSQALDADAKYSEAAGQIYEKMKAKQGGDAVDYYTSGDYAKELHEARQGLRSGLDNPMAQKLFDSSTLSTLTRTNLYGASYSGEQNRQYAKAASKARIDAISDQALANPKDEDAFQDGLQDAEDQIRFQNMGAAPETVDEAVAQTKSSLWFERIKGMAHEQPIQAGKWIEQAVKAGELRGEDIPRATNIVQNARNTVSARMISHDVSAGAGLRWGQGQVDIKAAGEAISAIESGGNYGLIGVQTSHGRALGKYQVMEEFLPDFLAKAGLPAMSAKDYLADHAAQDQVFAANFGAYMKQTGSANDAASMWFSGKPMAEAGARRDALGTSVPSYVAQFNAHLARGAPLSAKVDMGQRMAQEQAPDDPLFQDAVEQRITSDHNRAIAVRRDDEFQNRQVIETALMGGQDGKLPTTVEEIQADPKAEQAWQALPPQTQRRYMGVLARNAKGDHNWTDQSLRQYQQYKGQAQSDPASFLDEDVIGSDLPNSAKRELINLQTRLKGKAEGDPRVTRALGILSPDLAAAGIDRKVDKASYDQFVGTLADQIQDFTTENKRAPKVDEVKKIGAQLMQAPPDASKREPGWWGTRDTGTYHVPVPSDEAEKIKADPAWAKLQIAPTDAQVQRIYTRKLYQDLYGGTPKVLVPVSR